MFIFKNKAENTPPRGMEDESEIDWERVQMDVQDHMDNMNTIINPMQNIKQ